MWLLLVTMAAVAAVQGAQYGDYGAAKMPAYGEYEVPRDPPQDYHLPSAPASPELLDEVDNKVITQKSLSKDYAFDSWHKPSRKQSKRARNDDDFLERRNRDNGGQKYREDDDRIQSKTENSRDIRARVKHKRDQTREKDDEEFSIEKYIRGINENNLEADVARSNRKTTDRVIHRKARDRDMQVGAAFKESDFDEDLNSNRFKNHVPNPDLREIEDPIDEIRSDDEAGLQSGSESRSGAQPIDRRQGDPSRRRGYDDPPRLRPAQRARLEAGSDKPGDYDTDYYDVKRLQSMRKKVLPPRRFYQDAAANETPRYESVTPNAGGLTSIASVAEIELSRLLTGGRQRKEAGEPPRESTIDPPAEAPVVINDPPTTDPAMNLNVVNPLMHRAWKEFIAANSAAFVSPCLNLALNLFAIINVLQGL
ncbi:uncharacterized protein LOC132903956 [Amyelois transitella]|uniref:uncharacterized protein LOC132903956 n=1 Tax=Amyelois transitella TaxID=680683 RepID=UPI00299046BF|nr:uncharacterized protein LOC132903956 [Amyelois transitella]